MRLFINSCLKKYMLSLDRGRMKRLREKMEFLESGLWDAGVRVKKLTGLSGKVVFEARLSRGDRLLFTLGREQQETAVYLWGVVTHDHVQRAAVSVIPENAPFLQFEPVSTEDFPELLLDDLSVDYLTQEAIEEVSPDDYGPQKWLALQEEDWRRLLQNGDAETFEIFLHLTPEQADVLRQDPPMLLSGTAGSGKTTLSVYYLLKPKFVKRRRLFLTYHRFLRDFSRKIYQGLTSRTDLESTETEPHFRVFKDLLLEIADASGVAFDPKKEVGFPEFNGIFNNHRFRRTYDAELVWEEIRSIIKGAKPALRVERFRNLCRSLFRGELNPEGGKELREALFGLQSFSFFSKVRSVAEKAVTGGSFAEFVLDLASTTGNPSDRTKAALEKILNLLEQKTRSVASPLLSYEEYLALGRKRAPNFLYERKDIYDIAEFYQNRLERDALWDEIDLCRTALGHLERKQGARFSYDLVVCDEVQDFADIQLALIFSLAVSPDRVVLTGDPKQIINPSGFRWEEVKGKFYDRGVEVPEVRTLRLNFRCTGSIVRLSNALLDMKQELVGLTGAELREKWKFNGRPPFFLGGIGEAEVVKQLRAIEAPVVILVRTPAQQRKLKKALNTELVFTIHEAKGLEFDTVFLWKFSSGKAASAVWRNVGSGRSMERNHHPHIRHEINLLYVAVTRARNTLVVFDTAEDLWDMQEIKDLMCRPEEAAALSDILRTVSTPEQWTRQADYFFEREYYTEAAECYKNAGNTRLAELALALALAKKGDHQAAAPLLENHGRKMEAAESYEEAGIFDRACSLWETVGEKKRALRCRIALLEQRGEFELAADACTAFGDKERALANWLRAGSHEKAAAHHAACRNYSAAGEQYEKAGHLEKAADCYRKAKNIEKAASLFFKAGAHGNALPLFRRLKAGDMLALCHEALGEDYRAGVYYEKLDHYEKAIICFTRHAQQGPGARKTLLQEAEKLSRGRTRVKGALRYAALDMWEEAGGIFLKKGFIELAQTAFEKSGNLDRISECLAARKAFYDAAAILEKDGSQGRSDRAARLFKNYIQDSAGQYAKRIARIRREAQTYLDQGKGEGALARFKAIDDWDGVHRIYSSLGRHEEGLRYFTSRGMTDRALQLAQEKEGPLPLENLELLVAYADGFSYLRHAAEYCNAIASLFLKVLDAGWNADYDALASRFLFQTGRLFKHEIPFPDALLDLIMRTGHVSALYRTLSLVRLERESTETSPDQVEKFFQKVHSLAEDSDDAGLLACTLFFEGDNRFEAMLDNLPITEKNRDFFAATSTHYLRAVEFLFDAGHFDSAVSLCLRRGNIPKAAGLAEEVRDFSRAGRIYRDAGFFDEALRCFLSIGDDIGAARMYERMGALKKALEIWKAHERNKDIARVKRKLEKLEMDALQQKLFQKIDIDNLSAFK